ncbi:MAG: hypothetical protein ACI8VR_002528 [Candidatus Azotimanducaceae bacterium]|jgi:hypothetical protein
MFHAICLPSFFVVGVRSILAGVYRVTHVSSVQTHHCTTQQLRRQRDMPAKRSMGSHGLIEQSKIFSCYCVLVSSLFLTACTSAPSGISTHVIQCCPTKTYQTFIVTTRDMPAFLGPIMISNFSVALANHGLTPAIPPVALLPTNKPAASRALTDLPVAVIYAQDNLSEDTERDDFAEHSAVGDSLRFVAKIISEIREIVTHQVV